MRSNATPSSQCVVVIDDERRVVGEAAVGVDLGGPRRGCNAGRCDLIIDAPADILGPRRAAIRPPRVLLGTRIDATEHVDEAELVEVAREPGALLGQTAG